MLNRKGLFFLFLCCILGKESTHKEGDIIKEIELRGEVKMRNENNEVLGPDSKFKDPYNVKKGDELHMTVIPFSDGSNKVLLLVSNGGKFLHVNKSNNLEFRHLEYIDVEKMLNDKKNKNKTITPPPLDNSYIFEIEGENTNEVHIKNGGKCLKVGDTKALTLGECDESKAEQLKLTPVTKKQFSKTKEKTKIRSSKKKSERVDQDKKEGDSQEASKNMEEEAEETGEDEFDEKEEKLVEKVAEELIEELMEETKAEGTEKENANTSTEDTQKASQQDPEIKRNLLNAAQTMNRVTKSFLNYKKDKSGGRQNSSEQIQQNNPNYTQPTNQNLSQQAGPNGNQQSNQNGNQQSYPNGNQQGNPSGNQQSYQTQAQGYSIPSQPQNNLADNNGKQMQQNSNNVGQQWNSTNTPQNSPNNMNQQNI